MCRLLSSVGQVVEVMNSLTGDLQQVIFVDIALLTVFLHNGNNFSTRPTLQVIWHLFSRGTVEWLASTPERRKHIEKKPVLKPFELWHGVAAFARDSGIYNFFFPVALRPNVSHDLLIQEVSRSHSDTPQSVGFLWTSDQLDSATQRPLSDNTHHSQQTSMSRWDSNPQSQQASDRWPTP
jgi:hypothetical protein